MKTLYLSKPRGFCAGVVRAIDTVERALSLFGAPIYVKHEIVHNRHVVQDLETKGAMFIEDVASVPEGAVLVYSAHGVSPEVRKQAQQRGLREIDATCGLVTRVHSAVKRFADKGYQIILIGKKSHVEIIGTQGEAPSVTHVVEKPQDVEKLEVSDEEPLFYVTQTTLSLDDVDDIVAALTKRFPKIETLPSSSICYATENRQKALQQITKNVDLVLVVGDPTSSNSNRLCEVARKRGVPSYLVNSAKELKPSWIEPAKQIGLTAGASTPEPIVKEVIEQLRKLGVTHVEEVTYVEENVFFQLPKEVLSLPTS